MHGSQLLLLLEAAYRYIYTQVTLHLTSFWHQINII
jgi:hypothetical protein